MILTDTGPLVALVDTDEPDHQRCVDALAEVELPLITTWAAFTEAIYLLGRVAGWRGQEPLWRMVRRGDLLLASSSSLANERTAQLMERYSDRPMDLADATLVALAEELGVRQIFSLDSDFHIYRIKGRGRFEVLPS